MSQLNLLHLPKGGNVTWHGTTHSCSYLWRLTCSDWCCITVLGRQVNLIENVTLKMSRLWEQLISRISSKRLERYCTLSQQLSPIIAISDHQLSDHCWVTPWWYFYCCISGGVGCFSFSELMKMMLPKARCYAGLTTDCVNVISSWQLLT